MKNNQLIKKYVGFNDFDEYKSHKIQTTLNKEIFNNKTLLEEQREVFKNYHKNLFASGRTEKSEEYLGII